MSDIRITVTRSAGADGAVLVLIDTPFEPDGSDGPGLRVLINDDPAYEGVAYAIGGEGRSSVPERVLEVSMHDIDYKED